MATEFEEIFRTIFTSYQTKDFIKTTEQLKGLNQTLDTLAIFLLDFISSCKDINLTANSAKWLHDSIENGYSYSPEIFEKLLNVILAHESYPTIEKLSDALASFAIRRDGPSDAVRNHTSNFVKNHFFEGFRSRQKCFMVFMSSIPDNEEAKNEWYDLFSPYMIEYLEDCINENFSRSIEFELEDIVRVIYSITLLIPNAPLFERHFSTKFAKIHELIFEKMEPLKLIAKRHYPSLECSIFDLQIIILLTKDRNFLSSYLRKYGKLYLLRAFEILKDEKWLNSLITKENEDFMFIKSIFKFINLSLNYLYLWSKNDNLCSLLCFGNEHEDPLDFQIKKFDPFLVECFIKYIIGLEYNGIHRFEMEYYSLLSPSEASIAALCGDLDKSLTGDFRLCKTEIIDRAATINLISPLDTLMQMNNFLRDAKENYEKYLEQERALFIIGSLFKFSSEIDFKGHFSLPLLFEYTSPVYKHNVRITALRSISLLCLDEDSPFIVLFEANHINLLFEYILGNDIFLSFYSFSLFHFLFEIRKKDENFMISIILANFPSLLGKLLEYIKLFPVFKFNPPSLFIYELIKSSSKVITLHPAEILEYIKGVTDQIVNSPKKIITPNLPVPPEGLFARVSFQVLGICKDAIDPTEYFDSFFTLFLIDKIHYGHFKFLIQNLEYFSDLEKLCISYISRGMPFSSLAIDFVNEYFIKNRSISVENNVSTN
jgi:hypothetical protein